MRVPLPHRHMINALVVALAWIGTIWLVRLPYRIDPETAARLQIVPWLLVILFALGLTLGIKGTIRNKRGFQLCLSGVWTLAAATGLILLMSDNRIHSSVSAYNECISNLRKIDGVIESIAHERGLKPGAVVSQQELAARLNGKGALRCREGGTYTYGMVGDPSRCSVAEHFLPETWPDRGRPKSSLFPHKYVAPAKSTWDPEEPKITNNQSASAHR